MSDQVTAPAKDKTCADRITKHFASRLEDAKDLVKRMNGDSEEDREAACEEGYELPLCVELEHVVCIQLSTGGPGDEIRVYLDNNKEIKYGEYWFLDWFDGAHILLEEEDLHTFLMAYGCEDLSILFE